MGFSLSWVAFKGLTKADVLHRTGFRATGSTSEEAPTDRTPFAFCAFPTGWAAIFSSDYRYAAAEGLGHLSQGVTVLGCQIEEHIMFSAAALYTDGHEVWRVAHESDAGRYDLQVSGTLPPEYEPIRKKLVARQDASGGARSPTDFVYDIPVELARALTGYRHDEVKVAWGIATYEPLEAIR